MLERISSQGSESVKGKGPKGFQVFGGGTGVKRNQTSVAFHVVISELRAELLSCKQLAAGQPCTLLWVRGDTVHVTEDSVGQTVLSWSDTYFSQMVTLQAGAHGYKAKECKFKVQQKGKTIAKTAVVDLAKYCSEVGLAKEASVAVPLQPVGTLYFVVSTAPAADQHGGPPLDTAASQNSLLNDGRPSYGQPSVVAAGAAGDSGYGAGGANSQYSTLASKYSVGVASAAGGAGAGHRASGADDEGDRPSNTRSSAGGARPAPAPKKEPHEDESISSFFRRKKGPSSKAPPALVTPLGSASGPAPASGGGTPIGTGPVSTTSSKQLRKTESARASPSAWERNLASELLGSDATASPSSPVHASKFSSRRSTTSHGLGGGPGTGATATPQQQPQPQDGARRGSGASYHSDVAGGAGAGAASSAAKAGQAGSDTGGGGGPGWGAWIRGGMGWGTRSSNHSATGTSTPGAASQASLHGPGGAGGGGEPDSGGLEAAIRAAAEPAELRDLALDMLHERDEWRNRALAAQDALGRAQTARGAAVREAQRLEVRLREYQDELGRRTDGSLLQELVEAKVRIAELANENLRLRRQITHMGPLFYGDSGEDPGTPHKPAAAGS
ncbi:hypothetical protein HYH02_013985 [Chlamydomonas schloesseri]|uniref:C2 NT-type domain-containing protein n=1 Tax=Chlamydomonas schloesseri TaxID=2026947 RepID=A0A835SMC9_9CHLO|nr:hypothetical protein HYH02_013985 [Chlamydomonas schloesseri]|eukprot:KAG2429728.1 hypothetical protein HYH02_013985 [Chlamydomonas schloesseri]